MNDVRSPTRRRLLQAMLAGSALTQWPSLSFAGTGSPGGNRFVFFILRGGMDGLAAVPATGDPSFAAARGPLAQFGSAPLPLDNTFALHPNFINLQSMYRGGEASVVHAVGLQYRQRSHFDAQQVLESGANQPYELSTGWLARALAGGSQRGIAMSAAIPLVLRGPGTVDSWAPSTLPDPAPDLLARIERMYAGDAPLANALTRARALRADPEVAGEMSNNAMAGGARGVVIGMAKQAGEFLAQPHGPQAAVLELGGWDSHVNQASPTGQIALYVKTLDDSLAALRESLRSHDGAWSRTVVVVVSEFGRTIAMNGTNGTDHGTGGAMFLLGGAIKGGRVIGDWPGLATKDRYEGRDLRITTDVRSVLKPILSDHLQVATAKIDRDVFPNASGVRPLPLFG